MKFNKKCLYAGMFSVMLLQSTPAINTVFAADNIINNNDENYNNGESEETNILTDKEIVDDLDNLNEISPLNTVEGFEVNDFAGLRSFNKKLILTNKFGFFKIMVKNTGSEDIKVGIGNYIWTVPAHQVKYIKNPKGQKWSKGTYTVGFTCGGGMYGSAEARISDSFNEFLKFLLYKNILRLKK